MKKVFYLAAIIALNTIYSVAQDAPKYEKVFYKTVSFENDIVKVEIDNIVSLPKETKFRMSITNKTSDYLIYNSEESNFEIPGQDVRAKDKSFMIEPNGSKKKVYRAFGENLNEVQQFNFVCEGFYQIKLNEPFTAENFRLPVSTNTFKVGPYDVSHAGNKKATGKTDVKFNVTYKGDNLGFIIPNRIAVKMPDGNTYATANSKDDAVILKKGESDSFSASWGRMPGGRLNDMQLVEMWITFTEVFVEGVPTKKDGETLEIVWDEAMTAGKN